MSIHNVLHDVTQLDKSMLRVLIPGANVAIQDTNSTDCNG